MVAATGTGGAATGGKLAANGHTMEAEQEEESKARRFSAPWAYARSLVWVRPMLILAALYVAALCLIVLLFSQLPTPGQLAEKTTAAAGAGGVPEQLHLAVPHSFEELRRVRRTLELYRQNYAVHVAALMVATHIFLQAFMMPGSIFINVLAGSMYPLPVATAFAAVVDCCGAAVNYWLSRWLLRDVVAGLFPARVQAFATEMKRHQGSLLNYNLFIRTAPIFPSWLVNLASPIVGVPFRVFVVALLCGHLPINFISVKAGHNLATMQSMSDMYSTRNVLVLLLAGALALVPVLLRRLRRTDRAARHFHPAGLGLPSAAAAGGKAGGGSPLGAKAAAVAGSLLPVISLGGGQTSARPGAVGSGLASVVVMGGGGGSKRAAGGGVAPPPPQAAKHLSESTHVQ
ncbi:hypothetical protein ABPG75_011699 [Micractinium tetrahymenae]